MKVSILLSICFSYFSISGQNLVSSDSWTVSSGTVGKFLANGTAAENVRELGTGPGGTEAILWKAIPDGGANADGGWDTEAITIDATKMYRFSVWMKKTNSNDGYSYFGCDANDILNLAGTVNSNPYFFVGDLPALNKWYLLVGYVHGSNDPSDTNYGGIYDGETGAKVVSLTDFRFSSSATTAKHRTYLYYDPNTSDRQFFYDPQVYQLGTNSPLSESNTSTLFNSKAFFNDRVGVGTANPLGDFHLHSSTAELFITTEDWAAIRGNGGVWLFGYDGEAGSEDVSVGTQSGEGSRTLTLAAGGTARMKILSNGNIGIGTPNPSEKLTVHGTIYGKEVKVDLSVPGPDYVFEKDYDLPSLNELRDYINLYKHLPEVPSARDMEENGINVGEMNMILLKKVEELTLYVIQQQSMLEKQTEQIQTLKNEIATMRRD